MIEPSRCRRDPGWRRGLGEGSPGTLWRAPWLWASGGCRPWRRALASWGPGLAGEGPGGPGGAPGEEGAALPQACLCCCLPALLAAPSDVPPATRCLAFHVFAQKYPPSKGTLKYGNYNAVSLPNTLPVLQLTGRQRVLGQLSTDGLLGLVDEAARLSKANCGERTAAG